MGQLLSETIRTLLVFFGVSMDNGVDFVELSIASVIDMLSEQVSLVLLLLRL